MFRDSDTGLTVEAKYDSGTFKNFSVNILNKDLNNGYNQTLEKVLTKDEIKVVQAMIFLHVRSLLKEKHTSDQV